MYDDILPVAVVVLPIFGTYQSFVDVNGNVFVVYVEYIYGNVMRFVFSPNARNPMTPQFVASPLVC